MITIEISKLKVLVKLDFSPPEIDLKPFLFFLVPMQDRIMYQRMRTTVLRDASACDEDATLEKPEERKEDPKPEKSKEDPKT